MAHGQSNQCRRAGWLVAACGLVAAVGCHGPEKDASLDSATKQRFLTPGDPPGAKPGTRNAALDQRFDRAVPTTLPSPQLSPQLTAANGTPAPNPAPSGTFVMPTQPTNVATFGGPRPPADPAPRPQPPAEPVVRAGGIVPRMPEPLPSPGEPEASTHVPIPSGVLPVAPLSTVTPEPDFAPLPSVLPPVLPPAPPSANPTVPPLPEYRDSKYPPLPSPTDLPPIVK